MSAVEKKSHKTQVKSAQFRGKATEIADEEVVLPAAHGSVSQGLGATIATNAAHYDKLPYVSNPFPFSQPSHIGAIARLFGLTVVDPARAHFGNWLRFRR